MRIALSSLLESKCPNLWHDILAAGKQVGGAVEIPAAQATRILARCADPIPVEITPPSTIKAIPYEEWPMPLQFLAKLAKPEDSGLGDVIERVIGPIGGNAFKIWFKRATGRDCGCGHRKQALNELYPLLRPERCFPRTAGH